MRLNMLDPCLPLEYPVNVYEDVLEDGQVAEYSKLASLAEAEDWEAALAYISDHQNLINTARLRVRPGRGEEEEEQSKTFLWTVLHWAASSSRAGRVVILKLLQFGALKSLRTGLGETAHDIAVRKERPAEILALLEEPEPVRHNKEAIQNIEEAVHRIIQERVGDKILETGMQLPQMRILWEMSNESGLSVLVCFVSSCFTSLRRDGDVPGPWHEGRIQPGPGPRGQQRGGGGLEQGGGRGGGETRRL